MAYQKNNQWRNCRSSSYKPVKGERDTYTCIFIKRKDKRFARPIIFKGKYAGEEWLRRFKELNPDWKEGEEW